MLVVLDTSVLVAAWRSRSGASYALLDRLGDGSFDIAISVPLVLEYEAVLLRHLDAARTRTDVETFVDYLCSVGLQQEIFFLWRPFLRDPKDDMVAEVAVASQARAVVTHNVKDFAPIERFGLRVLTPGRLLLQLPRR
jgi:putative PIN family toxin of toxin-antitoxin system